MSISDSLRLAAIETSLAELRARVEALEEMVADSRAFCEARQVAKTPTGAAGGRDCVCPAQLPSSAPADDAVMASVVEACNAGLSIRGAADRLGLDRNKVFRLRQRAIAEGCLAVSTD